MPYGHKLNNFHQIDVVNYVNLVLFSRPSLMDYDKVCCMHNSLGMVHNFPKGKGV